VAARGEAKVESKQGYMEVEVEFDNLQSATRFGPEFLTYVMWAITPEGRATNMGEVILNGTKSKLDVTTELQAFRLSAEGSPGLWPRWRGDGKELFFVVAPNIVAADIKVTGSSVQPGVPHILFPIGTNAVVTAHTLVYHPYAVTPDGRRFLVLRSPGAPSGGGGLAGGFAAYVDQLAGGSQVANTDSVNVVLNWTRNLKRK